MAFRRVAWGVCAGTLLLCLPGRAAFAQGMQAGEPAWRARFDVAAGIGWFNGRPRHQADPYWYNDSLWYGVEAGYFWTEHVKLDMGVSSASEGQSWSQESRLGSRSEPLEYISSQHAHGARTMSAGLTYQFGRNAWVHPYLGAGVDVDRDTVRTTSWVQPVYDPVRGGFQNPYQLPEVVTRETLARPYAVGGVKVFFNQHVFFRADLKAAGRSDFDKVSARFLLGADF